MFFEADIKKKLYRFILDISLKLEKNQYTVMIGPSGAGKSMSLKIIAGIEKALYQRIYIDGRDISGFPPEKRGIVYLPQKECLFPHMNVLENLLFPFNATGAPIDKDLLERVIDSFKIGNIIKRMPRSLSGGEARRVALARAICAKTEFLLLDEPLSFLDFYMKLELIEFLRKLPEEYKVTILHVTHDPIEAFLLADKIYLLRNGRIILFKDISQDKEKLKLYEIVEKLSSFLKEA